MTDFVADCVTDFCIIMSCKSGGGEIVWCDICFILLFILQGTDVFFPKLT